MRFNLADRDTVNEAMADILLMIKQTQAREWYHSLGDLTEAVRVCVTYCIVLGDASNMIDYRF